MKVDFKIDENEKCVKSCIEGLDHDGLNRNIAALVRSSIKNKVTAGMQLKLAVEVLTKKEILALAGLQLVYITNQAIDERQAKLNDKKKELIDKLDETMAKIAEAIKSKATPGNEKASSFMDFMEMISGMKTDGPCPCPECAAERTAEESQKAPENN